MKRKGTENEASLRKLRRPKETWITVTSAMRKGMWMPIIVTKKAMQVKDLITGRTRGKVKWAGVEFVLINIDFLNYS